MTPEDKSTIVFKRGTPQGSRGLIPRGGHISPIAHIGASLLWKNAQKNAKKNITSDTMNKIIPIFNPFTTFLV